MKQTEQRTGFSDTKRLWARIRSREARLRPCRCKAAAHGYQVGETYRFHTLQGNIKGVRKHVAIEVYRRGEQNGAWLMFTRMGEVQFHQHFEVI